MAILLNLVKLLLTGARFAPTRQGLHTSWLAVRITGSLCPSARSDIVYSNICWTCCSRRHLQMITSTAVHSIITFRTTCSFPFQSASQCPDTDHILPVARSFFLCSVVQSAVHITWLITETDYALRARFIIGGPTLINIFASSQCS